MRSCKPSDDNDLQLYFDELIEMLLEVLDESAVPESDHGNRTVMCQGLDNQAGRTTSVRIDIRRGFPRARSRSPRRQVGESPMPQAAAEPHVESPDYPPDYTPVGESYPGWVQVNTGGNMERVFVKDGSVVWGDWKDKQWLFHATPDRHPSDWDDMGFHPGL